ncbi:MAG: rubrerythrin family protein [Synergistales bacterium]|nr:rubrerythrin family protein [Synergistales bacterium]
MKKTMENLAAAFAGESQANRKYLAFAKQADKEGYPQVAKLFRAVAEAETLHAHSHLKEMDGINSTEENLRTAMEGEIYEFSEMYPEFLEVAREEGAKSAERTFHFANQAEKAHAELYRKALEELANRKEVEYYLCPVCGYVVADEVPQTCPICGAKAKVFIHME